MIKTYSELVEFDNFLDRYLYLKLGGGVAEETFGSRRYVNQRLYKSAEWLRFKDRIILRDGGCDLAIEDYLIRGPITIHHINPITYDDILDRHPKVFDPENVVCCTHATHNAIHYGDQSLLVLPIPRRKPNDTLLW